MLKESQQLDNQPLSETLKLLDFNEFNDLIRLAKEKADKTNFIVKAYLGWLIEKQLKNQLDKTFNFLNVFPDWAKNLTQLEKATSSTYVPTAEKKAALEYLASLQKLIEPIAKVLKQFVAVPSSNRNWDNNAKPINNAVKTYYDQISDNDSELCKAITVMLEVIATTKETEWKNENAMRQIIAQHAFTKLQTACIHAAAQTDAESEQITATTLDDFDGYAGALNNLPWDEDQIKDYKRLYENLKNVAEEIDEEAITDSLELMWDAAKNRKPKEIEFVKNKSNLPNAIEVIQAAENVLKLLIENEVLSFDGEDEEDNESN